MSLLSTLDDITDFQPEVEEKEESKGSEEAPKLPRTNSLEDLGIKVLQCVCLVLVPLEKWRRVAIQLCVILLKLNNAEKISGYMEEL